MTPEHRIMNEIRLWCGEHDILCFRCNVGKVQCIDGTWFDTGLPEGFPDLLIFTNRQTYFCEVKTKHGRQHQAQLDFQDMITKRGYKYFVARSVDDVLYNIFGGDNNG